MSYEKNPVMKKRRLDNFDYSSNGAYFNKFCIMPDHIHLILFLLRENRDQCGRIISAPTVNIPTIIGQMKRSISKKIGFGIWQKSYCDLIIRNERDLNEIRKYIAEKPLKWVYKNEGNI